MAWTAVPGGASSVQPDERRNVFGNLGFAIRPKGTATLPFSGQSRAPRYFRIEAAPGASARPFPSSSSRRAREALGLVLELRHLHLGRLRGLLELREERRPSRTRREESRLLLPALGRQRRELLPPVREVLFAPPERRHRRLVALEEGGVAPGQMRQDAEAREERLAGVGGGERPEVAEPAHPVESREADPEVLAQTSDLLLRRVALGGGARRLPLRVGLLQFEDAALGGLDLKVELGRLHLRLEIRRAARGHVEARPQAGDAAAQLRELRSSLGDAQRRPRVSPPAEASRRRPAAPPAERSSCARVPAARTSSATNAARAPQKSGTPSSFSGGVTPST